MLYLYNSLSRKKEKFVSLKKKLVKMYVCGITPYDTTHLGHAFTYVWFDVLVRYLKYIGYKVNYAQNVTDIDDDILRKAKEEKRDWKELGDFWTNRFLGDMNSLNTLLPSHFVKATDSIGSMIQIIKVLLKKGNAYARDGNVYYDVTKFKGYGKLSKFNNKQMAIISNERGGNTNDPLKKSPLDFLLWRSSDPNEPCWKSPWGKGMPGWHIECSAMIINTLGDQVDIHGGGRDLVFPHHESEIAQSESLTGKKAFVKYWMHTSMVLYLGEKMAKSLGNLIMVSDLLKKCSANEIRFILLSHHYRQPWEFEESKIYDSKKNVSIILKALKGENKEEKIRANNEYLRQFNVFMDDDLDAPRALLLIVDLAKKILKNKNKPFAEDLKNTLLTCFSTLGFVN